MITEDSPIVEPLRECAKGPLHETLHTLGPRIPDLNVGDCHCNLLAEVALDALMPIFAEAEERGRQRGRAEAIADLRAPAFVEWYRGNRVTAMAVGDAAARYLEAKERQA